MAYILRKVDIVRQHTQSLSRFFIFFLFLLVLDVGGNLDALEDVAAEGVDHPGRADEPGAAAGRVDC